MVRLASIQDLDDIMRIYDVARSYMRKNGNMVQWINGYPQRERLTEDIEKQEAYVYEVDGKVHGVFTLIFGEDPTYAKIEGEWKSAEPYATIHRIGSDGEVKGVFKACINFAKTKSKNLRIDTHEDNPTMRHLVGKNGFEYCGVIYIEDLSPRMAFEYEGDL